MYCLLSQATVHTALPDYDVREVLLGVQKYPKRSVQLLQLVTYHLGKRLHVPIMHISNQPHNIVILRSSSRVSFFSHLPNILMAREVGDLIENTPLLAAPKGVKAGVQ